MIRKAVIVAAGLSSRLYPLTKHTPKGLLTIGKNTLLNRSIDILKKNGIDEIAIVVGFEKDQIIHSVGGKANYLFNPFYAHCNNMGSLWYAKDFVHDEPFIYLHSDIMYNETILTSTLQHFKTHTNDIEMVTDFCKPDQEAMKVLVDKKKYLIKSNKQIDLLASQGEWIGIAHVRNSNAVFSYIEWILANDDINYYDTYAFTHMAQDNYKILCTPTNNESWIEIDFISDYQKASGMF